MDDIHTTVDIDAPPHVVWDALTDFERYGEWNPQMRITGRPRKGERLHVRPGPEADNLPSFRPRVLVADPSRELRWLGHLLLPGVFDGEHVFELDALDGDRTRLVQRESFRGVLAGPIGRRYADSTREGFESTNEALKARAEARHAGEKPERASHEGRAVV
jgi:hypothetical protein